MLNNTSAFVLLAGILTISSATTADSAEPDEKPIKYVILASPEDTQLGASLFRVLRGQAKAIRFQTVDSLEKAVESDADVIVAIRTRRDGWETTDELLTSLKKRKVIGIGYGAGALFAELGLEIHGGKCAHFTPRPNAGGPRVGLPDIVAATSNLLDREEKSPIKILDPELLNDGEELPDVFAMHLPKHDEDALHVDAVVRFAEHGNYAPIVRQGNYMLIGIPVDVRQWTRPYERLVREICINFHDREPEKFKAVERKLTEPGEYEFEFAERGNTEKPFSKDLYFRFRKPTRLKLHLEHPGDTPIMMMFRGGDGQHTKRVDARNKEPLQIEVSFDQADINRVGEKVWELALTNFGPKPAKCKLTVTIVEQDE